MQETITYLEAEKIAPQDHQKLVDAFAWLLKQDKKQNPELYKRNQNEND
jgi:hypothetical protein